MSQYIPNPTPTIVDSMTPEMQIKMLKQWVGDELSRIARCLVEPESVVRLKVLYAYPVKFAPGDEIYADGVSLNPGSGEGIYRRTLAGVWAFVG